MKTILGLTLLFFFVGCAHTDNASMIAGRITDLSAVRDVRRLCSGHGTKKILREDYRAKIYRGMPKDNITQLFDEPCVETDNKLEFYWVQQYGAMGSWADIYTLIVHLDGHKVNSFEFKKLKCHTNCSK